MGKKLTDKVSLRTDSPRDFENLETIKDYFQTELADGNNRFDELVGEAPEEYKLNVAKTLLEIEFRFYQEREWTYNSLARIEQFPQLKGFLENLILSSSSSPAAETVSNIQLSATTQYQVESKVWQQGGQGALHKAKDTGLGSRDIVVKFLKDLNQKAHFLKEAYVTANLDHPGIVAVYSKGFEAAREDVPTESGRPFYAMRLVRGETLDKRIASFHNRRHSQKKGNPFASEEFKMLIESIISVCSTIEYSHSRGVLHCDIKPANIKCGPYNATFVLDWGSATTFDSGSHLPPDTTRQLQLPDWTTGSCTREFASPEQTAKSGPQSLAPASDVYCIGTTLYQVLTGQPPFNHQRQETDVCPHPRELEPRISSRLNAICVKATAHSPAERYQSAHDLGADLQHWLRDEEISAMPDGAVEKVFRLARRHKTTTIAAALLVAMLVTGIFLIGGQRNRQLQNEVESAQLLATGNQAFSLVEKICQPVARDETGGTTLAFANIVPELEEFTNYYIDNISNDTTSRKKTRQEVYGQTLVNAYRLKALISYFRYNNSADESPEEHIKSAIEFLENAENHSGGESKGQAVYGLLKGRLLYKKLQADASDELNIDSVVDELDKTIGYFKAIDEMNQSIEDRINHAEAHHLKGEVYLTFRGSTDTAEPENPDAVKIKLKKSELEFLESIALREPLPRREDFETASLDTKKLVYREIGRGYGYLGDVQKFQLDIINSIKSYQKSLKARQKLVDELDDSDENLFQLARGLGNFGNLARDNGDKFERSELVSELRTDADTTNALLADLVGDRYLKQSMKIREDLWQRTEDKRYRTDLAGLYSLFAELYLFAAMDSAESEKEKYFQHVQEFTDKVLDLYPDDQEATLEQNDKNRKAASLMLKLRASQVSGKPRDASVVDRLNQLLNTHEIEFTKLGDQSNAYVKTISAMNFEALLAYCVGLQAQRKTEELETALAVLKRKSNGDEYRIQRHFGSESVSGIH